jgi:hypothetical protein
VKRHAFASRFWRAGGLLIAACALPWVGACSLNPVSEDPSVQFGGDRGAEPDEGILAPGASAGAPDPAPGAVPSGSASVSPMPTQVVPVVDPAPSNTSAPLPLEPPEGPQQPEDPAGPTDSDPAVDEGEFETTVDAGPEAGADAAAGAVEAAAQQADGATVQGVPEDAAAP